MKRALVFFGVLIAGTASLFAQTPQEKFEQSLPDSVTFYLPKFDKGRLIYKDGGFSNGTFNVATLDQSLRFVSDDNSILSLSDIDQVDRVTIGGVLFIRFNKAFIAIVDSIDDVLLGVTRRLEIDNFSKKGAYGMESQTASIASYGAVMATGTVYDLDKGGKTKLKEYPYLYRKNTAHLASKSAFLKAFPSKKAAIQDYIDNNKVDFSKMSDVTSLFEFIKTH